ncbi:MAG: hypothetical protein Ct9H300mP7_6290 [Verrucomicrobiota bacterium]|nr:MAG: hypothetical protein Ct9H300mP7_6290 [Verrucomicrobiota bacterium]
MERPTFAAGHDFLPDGSALVATVHGESGELKASTPRSGKSHGPLCHRPVSPLGLKVLDGNAYVIGAIRSHGCTTSRTAKRTFTNASTTTCSRLAAGILRNQPRDRLEGQFYFTKCSENTRHGGSLIRISADGGKLDVFATGFRNPNGLGIGPGDVITVGDQQGGWVPETRVDVIAKAVLRLHADASSAEEPKGIRSTVSFVPGCSTTPPEGKCGCRRGTGILGGRMIHLSYGRCTALLALPDETHPGTQGAVSTPGALLSGACGARFNPHDGHLYVSGLRVADGGPCTTAVSAAAICRWRASAANRYATRAGELELVST